MCDRRKRTQVFFRAGLSSGASDEESGSGEIEW